MALLVSLAALAELAAARSLPVRLLVLWILRRAETAAGAFVFEATGAPPAVEAIAVVGNGPADALRLAARFHALAAALRALLPARPPRSTAGNSSCRIAAAALATAAKRQEANRPLHCPNDTS